MLTATEMEITETALKKINWIDFSIGLMVLAVGWTACLMMAQLFF
jgi:hypothetical protein